MSKLRLALVLPVIQVLIGWVLERWAGPQQPPVPTVRLICQGLNAPARLFGVLNPHELFPDLDWIPQHILGFYVADIFFYGGIALTWYLVGHALDHRRRPDRDVARTGRTWLAVLGYCGLLVWGVCLFLVGLLDFTDLFDNLEHRPYRGILTFLWAASLVFISSSALLRRIRHKPRPGDEVGLLWFPKILFGTAKQRVVVPENFV